MLNLKPAKGFPPSTVWPSISFFVHSRGYLTNLAGSRPLRARDNAYKVLGFRAEGFRVSGFRVYGFMVSGLGFRVLGLRV